MKLRTFAAMLAVVTLASVRPAGQTRPHSPTFPSTGTTAKSWTAPRTAWDDPDISGNFANLYEVGTPFERPEEFTGRQLGDVKGEELATIRRGIQERTRAEQLAGEIGGTRWIWLDSLDHAKGSVAWFVVDPPDGKIPPMTPRDNRVSGAIGTATRSPSRRPTSANEASTKTPTLTC